MTTQTTAIREDIGFAEVMQRILDYASRKQSFRDKPYCMERDLVHIHREVSEAFEAYRRCPEGEDWKAITEVATWAEVLLAFCGRSIDQAIRQSRSAFDQVKRHLKDNGWKVTARPVNLSEEDNR